MSNHCRLVGLRGLSWDSTYLLHVVSSSSRLAQAWPKWWSQGSKEQHESKTQHIGTLLTVSNLRLFNCPKQITWSGWEWVPRGTNTLRVILTTIYCSTSAASSWQIHPFLFLYQSYWAISVPWMGCAQLSTCLEGCPPLLPLDYLASFFKKVLRYMSNCVSQRTKVTVI